MKSQSVLVAALLTTFLTGCGDSPTAAVVGELLPPPAAGTGYQLAFDAVAPASEELWLCDIGKWPAGEIAYVGSAESKQTPGVHHMDIMALSFTGVNLKPGRYDCAELYDEYPTLMENGVFLYASQQPEQRIQLPEGVAAVVPPQITIMTEVHFVNTTPEDIAVSSRVNVYLTDASKVENNIWGQAVRDTNLNIPPMGEHEEWTRCVMDQDIDLLFLASHTHELGIEVSVRSFDGKEPGDIIYQNFDWATPFLKDYTTEPLHIPKGRGFEFTCKFRNKRPEAVNWGFTAADEMCQIALVYTPGDPNIACEVVDSSDGIVSSK